MKNKTSVISVLGIISYFLSCGPAQGSLIFRADDTSALSNPITIDFDSQTKGSYTDLAIGDVRFIADNEYFRVDDSYSGSSGLTGYYFDNGPYVYMSAGGFHSVTFEFAVPVNGFAFKMGWGNYDWKIAAYDSSMTLIESYIVSFDAGVETNKYFGILADGISYGEFSFYYSIYGATNDWVSFDNFTSSPVPVPVSVWLLGSGLAGLIGLRRKKK